MGSLHGIIIGGQDPKSGVTHMGSFLGARNEGAIHCTILDCQRSYGVVLKFIEVPQSLCLIETHLSFKMGISLFGNNFIPEVLLEFLFKGHESYGVVPALPKSRL